MEEEKSKSQKKRDADALQKLGVNLVEWSDENLNKLGLPDHVKNAIIAARSIKSHGAKRRQAQLIGKLMRQSDLTNVLPIYEEICAQKNAQTSEFHEMEIWRTRLIEDGREALTEFVEKYNPEDLQLLKQLIKKAVDEQEKNIDTGASRKLFRFIRTCINEF